MFGDNAMLVLFMIMLLGLALCSFLGGAGCSKEGFSDYNSNSDASASTSGETSNSYKKGPRRFIENYDNYNHYTKESYPSVFYGPNGETAKVIQSDSGNSVVITSSDGDTKTFVIPSNSNSGNNNFGNSNDDADATVYNGPNGMTAVIITDEDGDKSIRITDSNKKVVVYSVDQPTPASVNNNSFNSPAHTPYKTLDENTVTSSEVDNVSTLKNGRSLPNSSSSSSTSSTSYDKYLPPGIPRSDIPPGDEDLYILKSQVVPPVCPACPAYLGAANSGDSSNSDGAYSPNEKCPPCPACDRCPEPAYDCKLVPNYSNFNSDFMPAPVLSSFTTFGM